MDKQNHRSTVLIIDSEQTRSIEVDTRWLPYLKPTIIGLSIASLVLLSGISILAYKNHQAKQDNANLRQKVGDLEGFTSAEVNAKITELRKSEKAVLELQNYLQERGANVPTPVKGELNTGKPNNAAGGPASPALKVSAPAPFMGMFAQNTQNILETARHIPLGAPAATEISSRFGNRANPFSGYGGEYHSGLDFRGEIGDPIRATATGTVNFAGWQGGYGNVVSITHASGYETRFAHMSSIDVQVGQTINAGDLVGKVGSTGRSTGPHLHYEVRKDGTPIDPERFLNVNSH